MSAALQARYDAMPAPTTMPGAVYQYIRGHLRRPLSGMGSRRFWSRRIRYATVAAENLALFTLIRSFAVLSYIHRAEIHGSLPIGSSIRGEQRQGNVAESFVSTEADGVTVELHPSAGRSWVSTDLDAAGAISIGRVLRERYVILERLGIGGKGTVFRALDRYRTSLPDSQQHVALKVLHSGSDGSEQALGDLALELHCGQVLSHRNIVKVFELDRDGEVVFFTMELLDGELLSSLIERMSSTGIQLQQAWQIIRQLGAGLQHAHERGVIHGDLKPRNILITRSGELRILDFGAAQKIGRLQANPGQSDFAPVSGTPAYASCELLEGRAADPRDDLYALACISYELLTGAHPFACRPAILARNFGVKATRPAGLSGHQWRTLQTGLSWHRAGRSRSVHTWIQRLTHGIAETPSITPLHELKAGGTAKPYLHLRAAVAFLAMLLIGGVGFGELRGTSQKTPDNATRAAPGSAKAPIPEPARPSGERAPADALVSEARAADVVDAAHEVAPVKPSARPSPLMISVDGYQVISRDRFVEIRVHRNQLQKNSSFVWWTEPATARQDVDYVHQAKAILTFPAGRRSTRFYVKLLPESGRSQRDFFYVAIAQPGRDRIPNKVTLAQIWLPTPREQLQARR
jgi:serine/threonine protein kinase